MLRSWKELNSPLRSLARPPVEPTVLVPSLAEVLELFAQAGLGVLQRGLLGLQKAGDARFALNLLVEEGVAQLVDGDGLRAGALRADAGGQRRAGLDGQPLAGVGRVVDVGQVLAGDFHALLLRLQRARRRD